MPNWCGNVLTITGTADNVKHCLQVIKDNGDTPITFQRIVPMPQILRNTDTPTSEENLSLLLLEHTDGVMQQFLSKPWVQEAGAKTVADVRRLLRTRYPQADSDHRKALAAYNQTGFFGAYMWRFHRWGTPRDAYAPRFQKRNSRCAVISFDTAWAPPLPVIESLGLQHRPLHLSLRFAESGVGFRGTYEMHEGCAVKYHCEEYDEDENPDYIAPTATSEIIVGPDMPPLSEDAIAKLIAALIPVWSTPAAAYLAYQNRFIQRWQDEDSSVGS